MEIEVDELRRRAAGLRRMRRRIVQAAQAALNGLDPADRAELDPIMIDCLESALADEVGPLIAGLETEAAARAEMSEAAWDAADRHARRCADLVAL